MKFNSPASLNLYHRIGYLAFGGLFIYTGGIKLLGLGLLTFADNIRSFHLLQDPWIAWAAMFLPWFEVICGIAVITGVWRRGGLILLNLSLVIFIFALSQAWYRGIDVSCGCFGKTALEHPSKQLAIDAVLLLTGLWLLRSTGKTQRSL
jgi:putative oxidoreductase